MLSFSRVRVSSRSSHSIRPSATKRPPPPPPSPMEDDGSDSREHCPALLYMNLPNTPICLEDVRDIYDISQQVRNKENREAVFLVNNYSMRGVENYLHTIQYFERCWRKAAITKRSKK